MIINNIKNVIFYAPLWKKSLMYAIGFSILWWMLNTYGIYIAYKNIEILALFIGGIFVVYGFIASTIFFLVFEKHRKIMDAICHEKKEDFLSAGYTHVYGIIHFVVGVNALLWLGGLMFIDYPHPLAGLPIIFLTAFMLSLFYEVVNDLDDPIEGLCYEGKIPKEWREELTTNLSRVRDKMRKEAK